MANRAIVRLLTLAAVLFIAFIVSPSVVAKDKSPEIISVELEYGTGSVGTVTVFADNLPDEFSLPPTITLDGVELTVTTWNAVMAVATADLNAFGPGDYLLMVDSNIKKAMPVEMMLSLGAVGPAGPAGSPADLTPVMELIEQLELRIAAFETGMVVCPIDWYEEWPISLRPGNTSWISCTGDETSVEESGTTQYLGIFRCPEGGSLCSTCPDGGAVVTPDNRLECLPFVQQVVCSETLIQYAVDVNSTYGATYMDGAESCSAVTP